MAKNFRIQDQGAGTDPHRPMDARGNAVYTAEEVERINREGNRVRISGEEQEGMIGLLAASKLINLCGPIVLEHAKFVGKHSNLKRLNTQFRKLLIALSNRIDTRQMGAIANQMTDVNITVSASYVPAMVNIKLDDLIHICNRAMEYCDFCCTCTRDQSKDCALRKALDLVPGVKEQGKEYARKDATRCPYRGMEMEVDGDA